MIKLMDESGKRNISYGPIASPYRIFINCKNKKTKKKNPVTLQKRNLVGTVLME